MTQFAAFSNRSNYTYAYVLTERNYQESRNLDVEIIPRDYWNNENKNDH